MVRRQLLFEDRAAVAVGIRQGLSGREVGELIDRDRAVVWRGRGRNSLTSRGFGPVSAQTKARKRRARPQERLIDVDPVLSAWVRADLKRFRTPRQIAGRVQLEATDASVDTMTHSLDAEGSTVSHEAIYRWIYADPKGELAREGILLRSLPAEQPQAPPAARGPYWRSPRGHGLPRRSARGGIGSSCSRRVVTGRNLTASLTPSSSGSTTFPLTCAAR
ncbi:hypothetical protein [Rathayibacter rathayi]|uniref:hypothetical protein n=1 Tax=Rathayibacter rathayi TaxID=33887 RepID=UPI001CA50378|nr:hypothetical protein [Rathayibacter rathayi]